MPSLRDWSLVVRTLSQPGSAVPPKILIGAGAEQSQHQERGQRRRTGVSVPHVLGQNPAIPRFISDIHRVGMVTCHMVLKGENFTLEVSVRRDRVGRDLQCQTVKSGVTERTRFRDTYLASWRWRRNRRNRGGSGGGRILSGWGSCRRRLSW